MPGSPYTDLSRPPLHQAALQRALVEPGGLWQAVRVVDETGSTNADLAAAARAGEPEGLVLIAERQTAGRGRLDRRWEAPPRAGLTFSVLLRPAVPAPTLGWLPLLAGLSLVEAIGRIAVVDATVKWPNDLLVRSATTSGDYGKCAGILAETVMDATGTAVVVGIGLNVSQHSDELPPPAGYGFAPTSLALAGAASTDRDPLLKAMLRAIAGWYRRWSDANGDADACGLREAYQSVCQTVDSPVTVSVPGGENVTGTAISVDEGGRLVVRTSDGLRTLAAGDVTHVR